MNTELGFKTDYARTELFRPSFPPRVGRLWNNLPISDAKFTSTAHATELLIEEPSQQRDHAVGVNHSHIVD